MVSYVKFRRCTQSTYNNLTTKDPDCLYFVYLPDTPDKGLLYLGTVLISGNLSQKKYNGGAISIVDIKEVLLDEMNLADGDVLLYNEGTGDWENHNLRDLWEWVAVVGATDTSDGIAGLVPKPRKGDQLKFLMGDGTWQEIDTYDDELHAIAKTLVADDEGMSIREIAEDQLFETRERVNNLEDLMYRGNAESSVGVLHRVNALELTMGEFLEPLSGSYTNVGEALDYFDWSITTINDRMRWHKI